MLNEFESGAGGGRRRRRLRGALSGRRGKQLGLLSFFVPLTGYVIQDLRKPDSVIKALTQRVSTYLAERKSAARRQIDPAGRVEVLQTDSTTNTTPTDPMRKE
jgi:hypothetical protein